MRAASKQKWLEAHGIEHWTHFYTDYGREQQLRFFDYFLHGKETGWAKQPKVLLQIRHPGEKFVARAENEWPLKRTQVDQVLSRSAKSMALTPRSRPAAPSCPSHAMGEGLTFLTPVLTHETEITGPSALKLFASSSTKDADFFIVLRVFTGDLKEVVFQGAIDPHTPIAQGWLRASHRKLDKKLSLPYRPYHTHDKKQPLNKGQAVELDIEIWPTSIAVPAGYRIGLSVRGKDYEYGGASGGKLSNFKNELTGCGPFLHNDPRRPPARDLQRHHHAAFQPGQSGLSAAADHPAEKAGTRTQMQKGRPLSITTSGCSRFRCCISAQSSCKLAATFAKKQKEGRGK